MGQLASATAVDGHNWLYYVAYDVFDSETKDNWIWFMQQLRRAVGCPQGLVISSDACKGLEVAVDQVFPECEYRECIRHLYQNFMKIFHGKVYTDHLASVVVEFGKHRADDLCSTALNLPVGGEVYRLVRVRLVDGEPVAMETTEIRADVAPGLLDVADFGEASLYDILRKNYRVVPASAEQTLQAALSSPAVSRTLELSENAPVLELTRRTSDANGNPFEFVRSVYRGDSFVMKANLTLGADATQ